MEILLIFLVIIVIIIVIVMIKYYTDPNVRKAADITQEYHEKEETGEVIFSEADGYMDASINNKHDTNNDDLENILLDLDEYTEGDDYIELSIRGINFRNLKETNIGSFDGYIAPEINNEYDKHAIGIYGYDGTPFGFIEKGQEFLYNKIEHSGGIINVSIEVHTFINDKGENRLSGTIKIDKEYLM